METPGLKLSIPTLNGRMFFSPKEIVRLEACSNYTTIYFIGNKKILTTKVLKNYAAMLEPLGFIRTHRTHLVNKKYIHSISGHSLIMDDKSVAEISRRMKGNVLRALAHQVA